MFLSMTGFGRASREFPWGTVIFELTSVNHRYQDFSARLPRELSPLESRLIAQLRTALGRGKVRLSAEIAWNPGARTPARDEEGLLLIFRRVRELAAQEGSEAPSLASCLMLPGICEAGRALEQAQDDPRVWEELLTAAVESLMEMKRAEGAKLNSVIEADLDTFAGIVSSLEARWRTASGEALEALKERIGKVMERCGLDIDEARIAQEVSIMADKWDVSEELARLAAHIGRFRQTMEAAPSPAGKDPAGRRLDFLIQEMNREINTMGSKVGDADFRWGVVEAKSCLERIREQIQNVE
ncbi:MAG: YicC family protein [Fretibacterium sp.]|nr:YicC family protein [Fretibacterium sp.]